MIKIILFSVLFCMINLLDAQQSLVYSHTNSDFKRAKELFTAKKYVAAQQSWKCKNCNEQLNHTFQVDHKIDLQFGGTNEVSNLAALCNNCHANKTAMNNLQ